MKGILLILSVFLSGLLSGGWQEYNAIEDKAREAVVECAGCNTTEKKADFNDVAILPIRTATFSGDGNSFTPSVRPTNSGRRVQPSTKSAFLIIKAGKIFDRNNFSTFQAAILQFQSGIRSSSRYIYSICQLLI